MRAAPTPPPSGAPQWPAGTPALTIKQPWAALIIAGIKDVENRSWTTPHRGLLLIHAGITDDPPRQPLGSRLPPHPAPRCHPGHRVSGRHCARPPLPVRRPRLVALGTHRPAAVPAAGALSRTARAVAPSMMTAPDRWQPTTTANQAPPPSTRCGAIPYCPGLLSRSPGRAGTPAAGPVTADDDPAGGEKASRIHIGGWCESGGTFVWPGCASEPLCMRPGVHPGSLAARRTSAWSARNQSTADRRTCVAAARDIAAANCASRPAPTC